MNKYEPIKFDSWRGLAKYVIDGGKVYYHENQEIKCERGIFNFELTDNVMNNIYTKKQQPELEELIAIKPRLCWVWDNGIDKSVVAISDANEAHLYDNAQMLTDDEIKQFLSGE